MATKYWKSIDQSWDNAGAWFSDAGLTQSTTAPTTGDTVHVEAGTMTQGPGTPITLANLYVYREGQVALGAGITVTGVAYTGNACMAPLGKTVAQTSNGHLAFDVNGSVFTGRLIHQGAVIFYQDNTGVTLTDYTLYSDPVTGGGEHLTDASSVANSSLIISKLTIGTFFDYHTGIYYISWPFDFITNVGLTDDNINLANCPDPFSLVPAQSNPAINTPFYNGGPVTVIDIPIIEVRRRSNPKVGESLTYVAKADFYPPVVPSLSIYDKFRINVQKAFGGGGA